MKKWIILFVFCLGLILVFVFFQKTKETDLGAVTVESLIADEIAREKANIKGREIAKLTSIPRVVLSGEYFSGSVEVKDITAIEGGVEYLARAWGVKGNKIGFGKDGTVEWERFRVINPPILVSDPLGDIVREWTSITGEFIQQKFREDLKGALLRDLEHTIKSKKQKFGSDKIIFGKIGNTTTTVYPDPNPETTTVDGATQNGSANQTWADKRGGIGTSHDDTSPSNNGDYLSAGTTNTWSDMRRGIYLFDTSSIADTDTIDSATFDLWAVAKVDSFAQNIVMTDSAPSLNTDIATADFENGQGSVEQATARLDIGAVTIGAYNQFTLNVTGKGNISKTGVSKFGTESSGDFDNSEPTWSSGGTSGVEVSNADNTGTTQDPKLVVEHSAAAAAVSIESDLIIFE